MKRGVKKDKTLENIIIATLYFVIFSALILAVGTMNEKVFSNPTILNMILYGMGILASIVFLILFVSAWEDVFESDGHPLG